jgi:nucleoside-diphosphate-sugar epimerase
MTNQLILVTGAGGGQQGQTGRHVSEMLLARGVPVRAFAALPSSILLHLLSLRQLHRRNAA